MQINSEKVYAFLKEIPQGKVVTYKTIANQLNTKAYRAIGQILKHNPNPIIVPCHRVVKSNGALGGYGGKNYQEKIRLLMLENVNVENYSVDLEKYLWNPAEKNL